MLMSAEWRKRAKCLDDVPTDFFFPHQEDSEKEPIAYCHDGCPVIQECLEFAIATHQDNGIWGGTSARQRRRIKKERRAARPDGLDDSTVVQRANDGL